MSKPAEVSNDFMSFYQGAASDTIEKTKQAESNLGNIPLPIGVTGQCMIEKFRFGQTPSKMENGVQKEGTPFCEISVRTIAPEDVTGKLLKTVFWFSNKNGNLAENLGRFLSTLVEWGMPVEIRRNHKMPQELADWFMANEVVLDFVVTSNPSDQLNDGKGLRLKRTADQIVADTSIAPPAPSSSSAPASGGFQAGQKVKYNGEVYEYVEKYPNGKLGLKHVEKGTEVVAPPADVNAI